MKSTTFDYDELHAEILRSTSDPVTVSLMYEDERDEVEKYLDGKISEVSGNSFESLGFYCLSQSIVMCQSDLEAACGALVQASGWYVCALRVRWNDFERGRKNGQWHGTIDDLYNVSMALALSVVCKKPEYAREIAWAIRQGYREDVFATQSSAWLAEFMLQTHARWCDESEEASLGVKIEGHPYGDLICAVDARDGSAARHAVQAACDFHVARSKSSTSRTIYEFDDYNYRIFPIEIFAYLLVCKELKFSFGGQEHPLLDTCLGNLGPPAAGGEDMLLARALTSLVPTI